MDIYRVILSYLSCHHPSCKLHLIVNPHSASNIVSSLGWLYFIPAWILLIFTIIQTCFAGIITPYPYNFVIYFMTTDKIVNGNKSCWNMSLISILYSGARWRIQNLHFSMPKMCSITLQAEAWHRLKSSSFIFGLNHAC